MGQFNTQCDYQRIVSAIFFARRKSEMIDEEKGASDMHFASTYINLWVGARTYTPSEHLTRCLRHLGKHSSPCDHNDEYRWTAVLMTTTKQIHHYHLETWHHQMWLTKLCLRGEPNEPKPKLTGILPNPKWGNHT